MRDYCATDPDRLKGIALLPLQALDLAIEEARRAVTELGFVGVTVHTEPVNGRLLYDEEVEPLWTEVERLGAAVCLHGTSTAPGREDISRKFLRHPSPRTMTHALSFPDADHGRDGRAHDDRRAGAPPRAARRVPRGQLRLAPLAPLPAGRPACQVRGDRPLPAAERVLPAPVRPLHGSGRGARGGRDGALRQRHHGHLHRLPRTRTAPSPTPWTSSSSSTSRTSPAARCSGTTAPASTHWRANPSSAPTRPG